MSDEILSASLETELLVDRLHCVLVKVYAYSQMSMRFEDVLVMSSTDPGE
jgi:hypothetical protein